MEGRNIKTVSRLWSLNPKSVGNRSESLTHEFFTFLRAESARSSLLLCGPPRAPLLPPFACRVGRVRLTHPIWTRSDHQSAWICTWWGGRKKKHITKRWAYPLSDIWSRVRDQGGGSQRSWDHFKRMADLHHMASKKAMETMVRFPHLTHFLLSPSLFSVCRHHWPLTSLTRLVFIQRLLYN